MLLRFILLMGLCLSFITFASEKLSLTIYTEEFPPYNFTQQGVLVGINVEIVKQLCEGAGIACRFELLPWNRAFQQTNTHANSGLISTSRNQAREQLFHWVGPLASSVTYFYKLTSRDDITLGSTADAAQYTVGIQRNDIYQNLLKKHGFIEGKNLLLFSAKHQDMKLFFDGKLDLILGSELTLPYQVSKYGQHIKQVEAVLKFDLPELQGNYLALNRETSGEIVEKLQQQYRLLLKHQKIQPIIDKYKKLIE